MLVEDGGVGALLPVVDYLGEGLFVEGGDEYLDILPYDRDAGWEIAEVKEVGTVPLYPPNVMQGDLDEYGPVFLLSEAIDGISLCVRVQRGVLEFLLGLIQKLLEQVVVFHNVLGVHEDGLGNVGEFVGETLHLIEDLCQLLPFIDLFFEESSDHLLVSLTLVQILKYLIPVLGDPLDPLNQ